MRKWILFFTCGALLGFGALPLRAEEIIRIEVAKGSSDLECKTRVQRLELAVEQLQRKVFDLEKTKPMAMAVSSGITCTIKTPFDGIFSATEPSESAARANVLEKCKKKSKNSIYCGEKELDCGK